LKWLLWKVSILIQTKRLVNLWLSNKMFIVHFFCCLIFFTFYSYLSYLGNWLAWVILVNCIKCHVINVHIICVPSQSPSQGCLHPLRTRLKAYNFFKGGQLFGLQGGGSYIFIRTWPEVFCVTKNAPVIFGWGSAPDPTGILTTLCPFPNRREKWTPITTSFNVAAFPPWKPFCWPPWVRKLKLFVIWRNVALDKLDVGRIESTLRWED